MSSTLVTGIGELVTCDGSGEDRLGIRSRAALVTADGLIGWIGPAAQAPATDRRIDVGGRAVIPGFVDSHSHLVFAGDRSQEFAARMAGRRYDGGGIGLTVAATRETDDASLTALVAARVAEARAQGTTTIEIKSGYGLSITDEVRALRIASDFTSETTFLGAHVVPAEFAADRDAYLDLVAGPMLAAAAPYARWIDVFCEPASPHAFSGEEARRVLLAGAQAGSVCGCTATSSGPGQGCSSRSSLVRPASTTAATSATPTSTPSAQPATPPSPPCCPASSSAPARHTRTRPGWSRQVSRSRWPPTATPVPATPARCRG